MVANEEKEESVLLALDSPVDVWTGDEGRLCVAYERSSSSFVVSDSEDDSWLHDSPDGMMGVWRSVRCESPVRNRFLLSGSIRQAANSAVAGKRSVTLLFPFRKAARS